mgnify:FL=1
MFSKILQRLFPARLQIRKSLTPDERLRFFGSVSDNDPCLKALYDLLDDVIEANAGIAFDTTQPMTTQRTAWMQVGFCRQLMLTIENERERGEKLLRGIKT